MGFSLLPMMQSFVNNPGVVHFVKDPYTAVSVETACKGTFRPTFTMFDSKADINARKYSAASEALYQFLCLGIYLSVIPKFKHLGFKIGKHIIGKRPGTGFAQFKNYKEVKNFMRSHSLYDKFPLVNGSMICGSIVGSVIALTMFAPPVVHAILPSVLKILGIKLDKKEETTQTKAIEPDKFAALDVYQFENGETVSIPKNVKASQLKYLN